MSALPPNLHTQTSACQLAVVWAELTEHAQLGDRRVGLLPLVRHQQAPVFDHPGAGVCSQPSMITAACIKVEVLQLVHDGEEEA